MTIIALARVRREWQLHQPCTARFISGATIARWLTAAVDLVTFDM